MFSNTTPLNWYNTLRRLKKEGDFNGHLGKELGLLPGRKAFTSQLLGVTKHKPTHILTEAATPATKHVKAHKPRKNVKASMAQFGASDGDTLHSPPSPDKAPAVSPEVEGVQRNLFTPTPSKVQSPPIIRLESEREAAATKIQAIKRGNDVRKKLAKEQQALKVQSPPIIRLDSEREAAATKIQAIRRGNDVRKKLSKEQQAAATKIRKKLAKEQQAATGGSQSSSIKAATAALLSPETPSKAASRKTPVKPDSQMTLEPADSLPNIRPYQSLLPRRAGKKASSVKKVGIEKGKSKAGTSRALYRKKKEVTAPQNIIPPLEKVVKQLRPRKPQNKRTAPLKHKGKYDNPEDAALAHKYPLHNLRSKPKKDKKNVKHRLYGGLAQGLMDAGKGLLQMAGIGSRETAPGETAPTAESSPQKYDYNSFRKANKGKKWTSKKMGEEWTVYKQSNGL